MNDKNKNLLIRVTSGLTLLPIVLYLEPLACDADRYANAGHLRLALHACDEAFERCA